MQSASKKNDNKPFHTNEKIFYSTLHTNKEKNSNYGIETPAVYDLGEFWAGIWKAQVNHNGETIKIVTGYGQTNMKWNSKRYQNLILTSLKAGYITGCPYYWYKTSYASQNPTFLLLILCTFDKAHYHS